MTLPDEIIHKLERCRPYRDRLISIRERVRLAPREDWETWSIAERNLQLALECAIDVGEMLISWQRWAFAEQNRDVFRVLGSEGVLDPDLTLRLMAAAGFRNVLVHEYGVLDPERVRRAVLHDVADLDAYAKAVASFVLARR